MLGQNYFEKRLGDIYQYSRIPYKCGKGRTISQQYDWELCIDACGNIIFILSSDGPLQTFCDTSKIEHFSGISDDGIWSINCTKINILERKEIIIPRKVTLFCLPESITLKHKYYSTNSPNLAKAYFSNFSFSRVDLEAGFSAKISSKQFCFQMLQNSKQLIKLIDIGRINNAILSQVTIPILTNENIDTVEKEATAVSWFLSFLNLNANFIPITEYLSGKKVIQYFIINTLKTNFNRNFILDNFRIDKGIVNAFSNCYYDYTIWQNKIDINNLISFLVEINQQKYIDLKLATMLMAYEYLLNKYLINQNILRQDQVDKSIQDKLKLINYSLKFIPSQMMDDTLRGSVRNPLFHQGQIPSIPLDKKINIFETYFDLLIAISLKILGYTGKYMSFKTRSAVDICDHRFWKNKGTEFAYLMN